MSSDSEYDEFFDAEDVTPNKSVLEPVTERHSGDLDLDDLDTEEQELLKLKQQQKERRRQEDDALRQKLEALRCKKREEKEKKLEQEKKEQLEKRRRKHEELRRRITEKGDNNSNTSSSSEESDTEEDYVDGPLEQLDIEKTLNTSLTETGLTVLLPPISEIQTPVDQYVDVNINSSHPDKEKPNKQIFVKLSEDSTHKTDTIDHNFVYTDNSVSKTGTIDHNFIDPVNIVQNVIEETRLLNEENEPDIVRSTKTRTPPSTLQANSGLHETPTIVEPPIEESPSPTFKEPVAPPRRKKKLKIGDDQSLSARSSVSSLPSGGLSPDVEPASPGLPSEFMLNPNQEFAQLTKDLEHSLDLRSIIRGKKHIKAEDAEATAVNTDQDSPLQTLESVSSSSHVSSLDHSGQSKTSSLDRTSHLSKSSSLDRNNRKSKTTSLESRKSKSASLDKDGRRRSRNNSGQLEKMSRKESMNRPRSPPSPPPTEEEALEMFMVKNLDTGETVPLKDADNKIQKCIDPLVLHIMQRTNEYPSDQSDEKDFDTKSEGGKSTASGRVLKTKGAKLKKLFGKTVNKVKSVKNQVMHGEETTTVVEDEISEDGRRFKFKANHNKKGPYEFGQLQNIQDLSGEHTGAVWSMKFSPCGRLLATGGQDSVLRIWVLDSAYSYFDDMRQKHIEMKVTPAPSLESLSSIPSVGTAEMSAMELGATAESEEANKGPFKTKPFCKYRGHSADLLDVSWSKNYFILSSSMDKTVRLWHISRRECLCTFQHIDFVTAIVFHPRDDRYFLSGSLDGKLRLWNIPDKKVTLWNEVGNGSLITTANFCHNGKFAVVGTYDGKCIFYSTEHLKYYTQIHVRSTRGKNSRGRKITGIEPLPGEDKVLVTSNDSRVRLYDLRDLTLTCKYKGLTNTSSQIRASFSSKGKYAISGSEDHFVYLWKTQHEFYKFSSARRDRNDYYEAFKAHNAVVTAAVFAPSPSQFLNTDDTSTKPSQDSRDNETSQEIDNEFVISADFLGSIKVVRVK